MNYGLFRAAEKYAPQLRKFRLQVDHNNNRIIMHDRVIQLPANITSDKATKAVRDAVIEAETRHKQKQQSKQTSLFE